MVEISNDMQHLRFRWPAWLTGSPHPRPELGEPPLRGELFSVEQLSRYAQTLATSHAVVTRPGSDQLLSRLGQNEDILRAFNRSTLEVGQSRRVTPAAEWLLDNFYLIEEQVQLARRHLPRGYSRELPWLVNSASAGFPRVYDIVLELISHVDAQIDAEPLRAFIAAYQSVASLKLGELWAIPIMLRLGLIENLQRVTSRLILARADRDLADRWVDRLQQMAEKNPSLLVVVVADMANSHLPISSPFVAEFCQRLSRQSPVLHLARTWMEQRLAEHGLSIEQLVHLESQSQAADQVSVSHSITSLRQLSAFNWKEFVEALSVVEATLRTDPADVYRTMDFTTRDRYRHVIEYFGRHCAASESEVARGAIELAGEAARLKGVKDRTAHVGFYLIDRGQAELRRRVRARWPWSSSLERAIRRFPLTYYTGGIGLLTLLTTLGFLAEAQALGVSEGRLFLLELLVLICTSQLAVALMNWLTTLLVQPHLLPRLDYSAGIGVEGRTMVVIPTLLSTLEGVDQLVETLEIHFLANRDAQLQFGLLTDFGDALTEHLPGDEPLQRRAREGIERLNRKYQLDRPEIFYLFHRPRRWNVGEGIWMGYERKRGKLVEFNAVLRGGGAERFAEIVGDTASLNLIRYVITLDTDTQLPRDAARELAGMMAHPLNRPVFDADRGVVVEGYSILQPRVGVSLPSSRRSWFVRLFAGDAGIDPYTRAVSDVYQDLFQEGSFIGKGIYDVDAFQRAMHGRCPENAVLSHDLLEACHARSALVTDVQFYEDHPSRYNVDIARRHRWIRGDWQIAPWLLPRVPAVDCSRLANPLSVLSQWKIFDNLRRSLVPAGLVLLLLGNWWLFPELGGLGSWLVLAVIALQGALAAVLGGVRKASDRPWTAHVRTVVQSALRQAGQIFLTLAFLPYDAYIGLDAIGRTLYRLRVTRQRLLEWRTSSDSELTARTDWVGFLSAMWMVPALALLSGGALLLIQPDQFWLALPILIAWLLAPVIAWWISQPIVLQAPDLTAEQLMFLRRMARRTWGYFEDFVTATDHWLPPDNVQEIPALAVASRTSPTNMGLSLLANLAAWDRGYLSGGGLIRRTRDALTTMQGLERYRGHFYNWYETRNLQPLLPLYISSVDSGNLAGHLLTLGAGLREQADAPILPDQVWLGLADTVGVLLEYRPDHPAWLQLGRDLAAPPVGLRAAQTRLERLVGLRDGLAIVPSEGDVTDADWAPTLVRQGGDYLADLGQLAPWLALAPPVPNPAGVGEGAPLIRRRLHERLAAYERAPTLRDLAVVATLLQPLIDETLAALPVGADPSIAAERDYLQALARCFREAETQAKQRLVELESLARQCDELAVMDFTFLFDITRDLFSVGFNVVERRCDNSFYDLLASEARLCSYVAIALGQVPQEHWFALGRLLVASRGEPILVSWSGSMFEYLMPLLVMPNYENTLLDPTVSV